MDTECIIWHGRFNSKGYGRTTVNGVERASHRVAYERDIGPIPDGLHLDHLCRNRACVNPLHLEPVTCRVNLLRGDTIAAMNAAKTECKRGHSLSGDNLYARPNGARNCRACKRAT